MSRVNIVKKVKVDGNWKLLSIPRNGKGNYDWSALPDGLYLIEWRAGGKRRRESAGLTAPKPLKLSGGSGMISKAASWEFRDSKRLVRSQRRPRCTSRSGNISMKSRLSASQIPTGSTKPC